jgi:carboxyl-terminal processing protease
LPRTSFSFLLIALLLAPAMAAAQAPARPQPGADSEAFRRITDAFQSVRDNYVDELDQRPLATRCITAMEEWMRSAGRALGPAGTPATGLPLHHVGHFFERVRAVSGTGGVDYEKLGDACLRSMVGGLDKLSGYLDRSSFRELQVGTRGDIGAIGLELERAGDYTRVVTALDSTPAARADFRPEDIILSIDDNSTKGLELSDVVKLMRGKVGSTIVLSVERKGEAAPLRFELQREIIRVQSVRSVPLAGGLLYVRLSQFQERTLEDFAKALSEAHGREAGGLKGLVLDLRHNPGGLLHTCVGVTGLFLAPNTLVVELRGRNEQNNRRMLARQDDYRSYNRSVPAPGTFRELPLVVVVNRQSAACSEILAAALQDHRRARVLGEKTFGVGTVQTIMPMGNSSALKLTTSRYYRPDGSAMDARPVNPDVAFDTAKRPLVFGAPDDPVIEAARKLLLPK